MKRPKLHIYWFLLTLPFIILALYGLKKTPDVLPVFSVQNSYSEEHITVYDARDGNLYVFLPSYADMSAVTVRSVSGRSVFLDQTHLSAGMDCSSFALKTPYSLSVNNRKIGNLWFYQSANTAAIHIDTASESMEKIHADKNTAELSDIRVFSTDGVLDYHGPNSTLKGRGNSSWTHEKKPYTITLDKSNNLLGLGASSKWVLLANHTDETGLRNKLAFDYAASVGSYAGWAPSCTFVDLYLNGQYTGVYLLCEKIQVSPDFLDLDSDGYLMELMWANRNTQASAVFEVCPTRAVEVVHPTNCANEQTAALQAYLSEFQEALLSEDGICKKSGKKWSEYIDLDSWARKYLVEEILSNFDAGQASQYFWLNSSDHKLYAGPCWDYDLTLGKQWGTDWYSPYSLLAQREWAENDSWFGALYKKEEFRNHVLFLYADEFQPLLYALLNQQLPDLARDMTDSLSMNNLRWNKANVNTYEDGVSQMIDYLNNRIVFLDALWITQEPYCAITIKAQETFNLYVPYNTVCHALPQPEELKMTGIWYDQKSGEPFDTSAPICEDVVLVAKNLNASSSKTQRFSISTKILVIFLSVAMLFALFLFLAVADICHRWKERRNANAQSRS